MADGSQDGRSVRRLEDARFLLGRGRYVEDIDAGATLHGYVLRSPHAHALIQRIDVARGRGACRACIWSPPRPILRPTGSAAALPGGGDSR